MRKRCILCAVLILTVVITCGCIPEGLNLKLNGETEDRVQEAVEGVQESIGNLAEKVQEEIEPPPGDELDVNDLAIGAYSWLIDKASEFAQDVDLEDYYDKPEKYDEKYPQAAQITADDRYAESLQEDSVFTRVWARKDLDGNGIDELLLGYENPGGYTVSVIYTCVNGDEVVALASGLSGFDNDPPLYTDIRVCEDGSILLMNHDQMRYYDASLYRINEQMPDELYTIWQYTYDPGDSSDPEDGVFYLVEGGEDAYDLLSFDAFMEMLDSDCPELDLYELEWTQW